MISDAETEAGYVLRDLEIKNIPVDVFAIASQEKIVLCPTAGGHDFCGRLEYSPEFRRFLLYYPDIADAKSNARVRFSVGHELGHYYLEKHRSRLLSEHVGHNSVSGFICEKEIEQEADLFASGLLIPETVLKQRMQPRQFLTLDQILRLAADCLTSRESAAIRYIRYATEICAVIVSQNGKVLYSTSSDDAERIRFFVKRGTAVPPNSAALIAQQQAGIAEGELPGNAWCSWSRLSAVSEESIALGYSNLILTIVAKSST